MPSLITAFVLAANVGTAGATSCSKPDPLDYHKSIGMKAEYVGSVPTTSTDAFAYNMNVEDNVDGSLFFLDQLMGKIYMYDESTSSVSKIFDMAESDIPEGITLDWDIRRVLLELVKSTGFMQ